MFKILIWQFSPLHNSDIVALTSHFFYLNALNMQTTIYNVFNFNIIFRWLTLFRTRI